MQACVNVLGRFLKRKDGLSNIRILFCLYMQAPRVPFQALAMVVPPQEPDSVPSTIATPPPVTNKGLFGHHP